MRVMVLKTCIHCGSERIHKDGFCELDHSGEQAQRYRCRACGKRSSAHSRSRRGAVTAEKEAQVLALMNERMSQRGIARALKMSRTTVVSILEKKTVGSSNSSETA
jgi:transposase-like protein